MEIKNLFKKKKLYRTLSITFIPLAALFITATGVANEYSQIVNDTLNIQTSKLVAGTGNSMYYTSDYENLQAMMNAKRDHLREEGQEGTVLLKNDNNVLPIKSGKKIVVINSTEYIYAATTGGGSMSGEAVINGCTNLASALAADGIDVSVKRSEIAEADGTIIILGRNWGEGSDMESGTLALTNDEKIALDTVVNRTDKSILIISGDFNPEISEYVDKFAAIIRFGNAGYRGSLGLADVITGVVSPSGRTVDTYAANSTSAPAMMNFGNYAYTNQNKIMASQANKYVSYNEGIYIDYKYYETRYEDCVLNQGMATSSKGATVNTSRWNYSDEVLFPFGYGLSYTTFKEELVSTPKIDKETRRATLEVKVTNTGNYDAKDVVQVYAQSPYTSYDKTNYVEKSAVQLVGFEKTNTLKANGGNETVTVTVDLDDLASYDYTNSKTYIMEDGDYYFALGNGAHEALNNILAKKSKTTTNGMTANGDASLVYQWHEDNFDKTTYSTSEYTGATITNRFDDCDTNYFAKNTVTYLSRKDWNATYPTTLKLTATEDMIASLNDTKKYENGTHNDLASRAKSEDITYQDFMTEAEVNDAISSGKLVAQNVVSLRDKSYDDEGWKAILDNLSIYELSRLVAEGRTYINACPSVTFQASSGSDGPNGLNKAPLYSKIDATTGEKTAIGEDVIHDDVTNTDIKASDLNFSLYESEPVIASSFNRNLARERGKMYGEDALYSGTSTLWGLGADLHRTPYGGRTSEYFSADPILSGEIGSALSLGTQDKGVVIVTKHFAGNEQDQNRIGVATFFNEQTFRENNLKVFEKIATTGKMQGLMSAYNRVGLLSCTSEYDLLTGVLREEWGSNTYIISDLNSPTAGLYDGNAGIICGISTWMNNGSYNSASGTPSSTSLNVTKIKADKKLLYACREAAHRILFNYIHSNAVNGISMDSKVVFVTPWWKPTIITIDVLFTVVAALSGVMFILSQRQEEKEEK